MEGDNQTPAARAVIALPPGDGRRATGDGRRYEMGDLTALFKADEDETGAGCSISEWIVAPGQGGVGAHDHAANDDVFETGVFIRVPAGVMHDFRNLTGRPARLLNFCIPSGFEREMPKIVAWFAQG